MWSREGCEMKEEGRGTVEKMFQQWEAVERRRRVKVVGSSGYWKFHYSCHWVVSYPSGIRGVVLQKYKDRYGNGKGNAWET